MIISNAILNTFIDTTLVRLSQGITTPNKFYVDLRDYQERITDKLVKQCIKDCASRGLVSARDGDGLIVTVDPATCYLTLAQTKAYGQAIGHLETNL